MSKFEDILYSDGFFVALGIAIAYIPVIHKVTREPTGMFDNRYLKRVFITYPRITGWGYIFLCVIALTFWCSYKRDGIENNKRLSFEKLRIAAEKSREKAEKDHEATLIALNSGLVRRDTVFMQQLDKWGLRLEDSQIVKKQGAPFLRGNYGDAIFTRQSNDTLLFDVYIVNKGDDIATNVYIVVYYAHEKEGVYTRSDETIMASNIELAVNDMKSVSSRVAPVKEDATKKHQFIYVLGSYADRNGNNRKELKLLYEWTKETKRWRPSSDNILSPDNFLRLTKH